MTDGVLVIDKPAGPTSHDVVARVRRILGEPRIGHTGTLDPMATGVLPLVIGRATRLARFLSAAAKSYDATLRLGVSTDSHDAEGAPTGEPFAGPLPSRAAVDTALDAFRGTFTQQPPAFSAKKIGGRRSHRLARAAARGPASGGPATAVHSAPSPLPAPVDVTAHAIEIVDFTGDRLRLRIDCSAGFYVRALAHDLGQRLGTGAHLVALRRTRSGEFAIGGAVPLETIEQDPAAARTAVLGTSDILAGMPAVVLTTTGAVHASQGRALGDDDLATPPARGPAALAPDAAYVRLLDGSGRLVGIAEPAGYGGLLHPCVVLG